MNHLTALTIYFLVCAASAVLLPIKRQDPTPPPKIRSCATPGDLRWQPALDFDTDGCYNVPAVGPQGQLAVGRNQCESVAGEAGCRDESDLDNNNVYVRTRCNNGWCAHMYGYYFEKDRGGIDVICTGHRHDWEHVVVWVRQSTQVPEYVAASAHGDYQVRRRSDGNIQWDGNAAKIVYHKDGLSTHAFRFANPGEVAENHKGVFFRGDLISYEGFPSTQIRSALLSNDWGSASIDFRDSVFAEKLQKAKARSGGGTWADLDVFNTGVDDVPQNVNCT